MDDKDKGVVKTAIDAVKDLASGVSDAAKNAIEPELIKPGDQVIATPMVTDGMMGETIMPPYVVIRRKKNATKRSANYAAKKSRKKAVKKVARKSSKKKAAKKLKSPVAKTTTKKATGKKKKSRRHR